MSEKLTPISNKEAIELWGQTLRKQQHEVVDKLVTEHGLSQEAAEQYVFSLEGLGLSDAQQALINGQNPMQNQEGENN